MSDLLSYTESDIRHFLKKLRFPPWIERSFLDYYHDKTVPFIRYGMLFGTVLYLAHVFADFNAFPNLFYEALVMASSGIIIFTVIGDGIFAHLYHSGVMMALVGLFAFLRLRFIHVISGGLLVIIIYVLSHVFIVQTDTFILAHNASNMVGIVLIGVFMSYFHEYYIRQGYIQALQLEQSSQKLVSRNKIIERDLEQARIIQQRYVPESRPTDYIYALYKPMDMVGGDYFQFIPFELNDKIGIFISDVSGHGMLHGEIGSIESLRDRSSEEFVSGLYRDLTVFRGNEFFNDDICIICADI